MHFSQAKLIIFFRCLWIAFSLAIIIFILFKTAIIPRTFDYQLDFSNDLSSNIYGWYPQSRVEFVNQQLFLLSEPIYLDVYLPANFQTMTIQGDLEFLPADFSLGLRQKDGSWDFKHIEDNVFSLNFDLSQAQLKRNFLQLIVSVPSLSDTDSRPVLSNNWQIIFQR